MSSTLFVGMAGPREPIQLTFTDAAVDWSQTKVLTLSIQQNGTNPGIVTADGPLVSLTSWAWTYPDSSSAVATAVLNGTELVNVGQARLSISLTVGGIVIGGRSWTTYIEPR